VTVHRGADAADLSAAFAARSFTHAGEIYLPASHGPLGAGPARGLLAHELTHVVQQRRLGASLPPESSHSGQALEADAVAAERSSSLPFAAERSRPRSAGSEPHSGSHAQRAPEAASQPAPTPASESATVRLATEVQRAPAAAAAATARAGGPTGRPRPTERELEDLARQLYTRIGRRLRRDLLADRERAGMAMDLP
jgi:hypothetical protein